MTTSKQTMAMRLAIPLALAVLALSPALGASDDAPRLAPNFVVDSLHGGDPIDLDDYRGKVVYLDFWASWCGPCVQSFPFMEELHQKYAEDGLVIIAVNLDQNTEDANGFLEDHPVNFLLGQNAAGDLAEQYGVIAMPSSFVIGRDGMIEAVHYGFKSRDKDKIAASIAGFL